MSIFAKIHNGPQCKSRDIGRFLAWIAHDGQIGKPDRQLWRMLLLLTVSIYGHCCAWKSCWLLKRSLLRSRGDEFGCAWRLKSRHILLHLAHRLASRLALKTTSRHFAKALLRAFSYKVLLFAHGVRVCARFSGSGKWEVGSGKWEGDAHENTHLHNIPTSRHSWCRQKASAFCPPNIEHLLPCAFRTFARGVVKLLASIP